MSIKAPVTKPLSRTKAVDRTVQLKDRLLDAATRFFMEKGFDGTSMGEIAKHAHASKETFYRHFPTKEDLFRAVILRRAEFLADELGSVLLSHDPPEKALAAFGELLLDRLIDPEAISLHRVISMEKARFPELVSLFRAKGPIKVRTAVSKYLDEQVSKGRLREMDSAVGARQFFDLVAAEMIMGATLANCPKPSKAAMQQRVQEALVCFLRGYSPARK